MNKKTGQAIDGNICDLLCNIIPAIAWKGDEHCGKSQTRVVPTLL